MKQISVFIFFFFITRISWATYTQVDTQCSCQTSKSKDSFETPIKFNFGKYKGLCIDSCRFRSITLLEPSVDKLESSRRIRVSNFLHMEKYYIADIPISSLEKAFVGFEEFQPHIFHVVLRFDVAEKGQAIELVDQTTQSPPKKKIQTRSFVVSAEGVPPKDFPYGLVESYFENYLLALRVLSLEEETRWVDKMKNTMTYKKLNLTPEQVQKMAIKSLLLSHNNQLNSVYKLFSNNCATVAVESIASTMNGDSIAQDIFSYWDRGLSIRAPIGTTRFLIKNKLIENF
jgi:hypothetical protein